MYHTSKLLSLVFSVLMVVFSWVGGYAEELDTSIISPNLYVAPDGDDSNPGTEAKPFATLGHAKDAVRSFKKNVPKPITVFVREGTYYLSEPLVFTPEDSGIELQPITYAAYPGEKPTTRWDYEMLCAERNGLRSTFRKWQTADAGPLPGL